jgi:hypothetical protein
MIWRPVELATASFGVVNEEPSFAYEVIMIFGE